jgi:hypothetical protein
MEYAISRGLTEDLVGAFKIGTPPRYMADPPYELWDPFQWMAIPYFHHGELMGIKLRNVTSRGPRYMSLSGSRKGLWGYDDVYLAEYPVLLMKGEIAAMVARRYGFLSCAPTGGEGSYVNNIRMALAFAKTIVVGDNDRDPNVREKMTTFLKRRAALLNGTIVYPPKKHKDWDEWVLDSPLSAIAETLRWIENGSRI